MDARAPEGPEDRLEAVSRRRLLGLVGGAGLAAVVAGCSSRTAAGTAATTSRPAATAGTGAVPAVSPPAIPMTEPVPAPPAPTAGGPSAVMLCREAWGAAPPRPGGRPHTIDRMTIHHTAVVLGDNSQSPERLRGHQRYHQDSQGWIDIAYHVGVDRDGNIFELRTPALAGDTATDYDTTGHFLVVCEGDFDQEAVSEAQLNGAAMAFAWAAQTFHITPQTLAGHRDVAAATACPGASLYAHVTSGDLQQRIEGLLAAGPVDLHTVCGPQAAAIVAAIEAGR